MIDPAIVSFHRPLKTDSASGIPQSQDRPSPPTSLSPEAPAQPSPARLLTRPAIPIDTKPKEVTLQTPVGQDNIASATLTGPFNELDLDRGHGSTPAQQDAARIIISHETNLLPDLHPIQAPANSNGKRNRKGGPRGKAVEDVEQQHQITAANQNQNGSRRPKGWRQTNLTEDAPQSNPPTMHLAVHSLPRSQAPTRKRARRHRIRTSEDQNGWATGEATDIQDMGDFDFEGNLSKFDKQGVFDKIRQEDTTADEDRLVSFNRIPARPGTAGGKNLHYTENVLDSPHATGHVVWNSSDSEKDVSEARVSSGRSSRRNISRVSVRKPRSRKGSTLQGNDHLAGSGLLSDPVSRTRYSSHEQAGSPRLAINRAGPHYSKPNSRPGATLRIMPSDHPCPCLTPLQMVELEQLAVSELGLTEDIVTENASRGIAETVQRVMASKEDSRFKPRGDIPTIVILAGNNRSGARAIGAGRHLRNHRCQIVICVLGLEREDDLLDTVRRQLNMYRNCGGQVTKPDGLDKCLMRLHSPTELIIDALLGMHLSFDDLRKDDQANYFQLATWVNNSEDSSTSVLAVDVPSGLDALSGMLITLPAETVRLIFQGIPIMTDEMDLVIHADYVLSLGVPKAGLLTALGRSTAYEKWKLFVADIGISNMAWRKFGTRRSRHGVDFGKEWVATLRYRSGAE